MRSYTVKLNRIGSCYQVLDTLKIVDKFVLDFYNVEAVYTLTTHTSVGVQSFPCYVINIQNR